MPVLPILLADDDENDVVLFQRQLTAARVINPLHVVTNGEEVVDYLSGQGTYSDRARFPLPVLFFLDLKMPRIDGYKILTFLRANSNLHYLPTIVLSAMNEIRHVSEAYQRGAKSFLIKPLEACELIQAVQGISTLELKRANNSLWITLSGDAPVKPRFATLSEKFPIEAIRNERSAQHAHAG